MVTKDGDAKAAAPKQLGSMAAKPAAVGAPASRAAASPSRTRAGAVAKPTVTAAKPAPSPSSPGIGRSSGGSVKPIAAKAPAASKPSAAKPPAVGVGRAAPGSKAAPGKGPAAKGAKAAGGTTKGDKAAAAAAAPAAAEPGPDPAVEAARRTEQDAQAAREMEVLRQAAWQAQVEYERRQEAKRRQAQEEEARRKKEEAALRSSLLEAAYDGDDVAVRSGLARAREAGLLRPQPVDTADGHGNTLLSEAAAGGALSTVEMLLQLGADPNSRGEFLRTPLWRAAFLGKAAVVPALLAGGADPRTGNEGGELPEHVATADVKELLQGWDVARTDQLLMQYEARRSEVAAAAQAERSAAVRGAEESLAAAEAANTRGQQGLKHARMELEKRIHEYDTCVEEKKPEGLTQVALDQVHSAELVVEEARRRAAEAGEALDGARLQLRHQQLEQLAGGGEEAEALPGVPVAVRALNDVLIRDVGGLIAASGRWPLVIDPSGQASVFLRYQDTNYVNALNSRHLEPQLLRRSLLGSLRYGKAMVVDLQECDLWPEMPRLFDQVQPGLLAAVLDKSLLAGERYTSLIRAEDGEEYDQNKFQEARMRSFSFIVLTAARVPNPQLVQQMYPLRVMITQ